MLDQLVAKARKDAAMYRLAIKDNKPLSVIIYWANEFKASEEAVKKATKWNRGKLIDVITNGADY